MLEREPLVERVLGKLESFKNTLTGNGEKYSLAEKRRIDKALKLYLKAAEASGKTRLASRIRAMLKDEEENSELEIRNSELNADITSDNANKNTRDNSADNTLLSTKNAENPQKEPLTNINQGNMHVSEGKTRYSFKKSQNGLANDGLTGYSGELRDLIEERGDIIVDSYEKLVDVVNLAFDKPDTKATAYFGIIDVSTLEKIKNSIPNLPKELEGKLFKEGKQYSVAATLDSIRHLVDDKGLTRTDVIDYLDRFADTILDFDSTSFDYYIDSYKNKVPGVLFKKIFEDGTLVSFDIVSHKKRSVALQTLYMESADYQKKKSPKTLPLSNDHSHTPEVRAGKTSSIDSIPDSAGKVNSETKFSRKTDQERSTLTKGEAQKQRANYKSDKVYTKTEIAKMVESLNGLSSIPKRFRTDIVNDIWTAFNSRYSPDQRERHSSILADKIFARVMQELIF